jgi:hypothetical protein
MKGKEGSREPPVEAETEPPLSALNATATFRLYSAVTKQRGIALTSKEVQLELCAHLYEAVREVISQSLTDPGLESVALCALKEAFVVGVLGHTVESCVCVCVYRVNVRFLSSRP